MERRHSVTRNHPSGMRGRRVGRAQWLLVAVLSLASALPVRADSVVLIVSAQSPIHELESGELRKLFMGFRVVNGDVELHAARNRSDSRLDKIFLQNVVALSELMYERQLLARKMREGSSVPTDFTSDDQLLDEVAHDPRTVSYTWASAAAKRSDVRVVRVLWHD
jgi:hypothetical protein